MKRLSVKQKLTLWITLLMLLLVVLVLGYMLAVSSSVVTEQTSEQLTTTLRDNLSGISRENGALAFSEDFSFTRNGVYTLVYGGSGALQAGQVPLSFPVGTTFENGVTRMVSGAGDDYFVLDYWLHFGWEDGVWVRGIIPASAPTGSPYSPGEMARTRMCSLRHSSRSRDPFLLSRLYIRISGICMQSPSFAKNTLILL